MSDKFYKFHFKNEDANKASSYNVDLKNFTEALQFAYDKLDELNNSLKGYRIIGIYEIVGERNNHVLKNTTN
jgi:hypothetical protein|tara:strand:- start:1224 stop:1439 length:216 start_codon:yes stop_codon:yes gene_type:complete